MKVVAALMHLQPLGAFAVIGVDFALGCLILAVDHLMCQVSFVVVSLQDISATISVDI